MSGPEAESPVLAHMEALLATSYRKEIEQEENIWRSLPFFAATLALQLAALFQVIERLPPALSPVPSVPALVSRVLVGASVACSLLALSFLAASISRARFRYIAGDQALLGYALSLEDGGGSAAALDALKANLAAQYAVATDNNRRINKQRESRRSVAGLLTLLSVFCTLSLVAEVFVLYAPGHHEKASHDATRPDQPTSGAPRIP